ncbi:transmembrane protein, putative (macronuclear) [Tetrahymena thermophila SB210]|uniref:Transmembrane protein, putative n=1 Tax=Tetrahymena thermophila (strain SB210) TaxID=312017 RepID=Q235I5_TETTS|nr:transmembrane protein, putative [Tetrahymena thermophila SB210]EAR92216.1 transmembrane protein, putative [Tetrahymena thermophila SB210]|eukprot:XP_001012461.1 transmembrane protein, putative [Tetrahymena thermophila SB210]
MNKAIVFVAIIAFTVALMDDTAMTGGWYNYKFSNGFQSDNSNPLTKIFKKLSAELQEKGISDIQFTSVTSQVVNGQNFKIRFTYTQIDSTKTGYCLAYVSFSGETCEIHEVELETTPLASNKDMQNGGWSNLIIPSNFESDPNNPLTMAMNKISNELMMKNMTFVKFVSIQSQVVAGQKFKIQFQFLNKNGQMSIGNCLAYVRSWENFVEVSELSFTNPLQLSVQDNQNQNGGWSSYNFNVSELQNGTSMFSSAYSKLVNTLLKQAITIVSVSHVESQVVSGVNFKISFIYAEKNNLKTGKAIVYIQEWTQTIKITSLELAGQAIQY